MQKSFNEGHAVRLSEDELRAKPPAYYFPHFALKNNRWSEDCIQRGGEVQGSQPERRHQQWPDTAKLTPRCDYPVS